MKKNIKLNSHQLKLFNCITNFMKNFLIVFLVSFLLTAFGCTRQKDIVSLDQPTSDKPALAARYPSTPEELALVGHLSEITEVFKVLYKKNANVRLVNASIYAHVFADETVLLGDLIFPAQSRLPLYTRFDSLSRAWNVDLTSFAQQFWSEVQKRNNPDLEQFLQGLMPSVAAGQYGVDNGTAPPVSVYFPYSELFAPSTGGAYLPTVSLLNAAADIDEAPGSEPVYQGSTLTGYTTVLVNDVYTTSHPTHIVGVNGPEQPATGPGGGGIGIGGGGFCFGPGCMGWIPPPTTVPVEIKRSVLVDNYVLKAQYDNLISFTGNGGGSEVRINRISAHLQPTIGSAVTEFAPLPLVNAPPGFSFDQTLTSHTRQEISDKVWKKTLFWGPAYGESRWDTSWVQDNFEQVLAVWEYDNTNQRASFNGQLYTTLIQTTSTPMALVGGVKPYSVQAPSMHPPIKHLRISRSVYFGEARNNFGFGYRPGNCGTDFIRSQFKWDCTNWSDYAGLDPYSFSFPSPANQTSLWPARDVHWDTKAGSVFGWVWPYRVYYNGGYSPIWF